MDWGAVFTLHRGIPREGPGSDEATREALRRLPPLPATPRVLDLGCGPGRQTLVLARELQTPIVALDFHAPYLACLEESAAAEGLAELVITRHARMEDLDEEPGTVDLIWAEGSIFILGFAEGLRQWRPLLREGGLAAVTDATWIIENPPAGARAFWDAEYPAMTTVDGNVQTAVAGGYEVLDHFVLPQSAWWDEYYTPLSQRIGQLRPEAAGNPGLAEMLDETEREIAVCDQYGDSVGYVFYLMRRAG